LRREIEKMRPRNPKTDANQKEIIAALLSLGFEVWDLSKLGGEVLDLHVYGYDGVLGCERWLAVEVKVPGGTLTDDQQAFISRRPRAAVKAETPEDVLRAFGRLRDDAAEIVPSPVPDSYARASSAIAAWRASSDSEYFDLDLLRGLIAREIRDAIADEDEMSGDIAEEIWDATRVLSRYLGIDAKPSAHDAGDLFASALQGVEPSTWDARFSSVLDDLDDGGREYEMFLRDLAYEIGERLKRLER
jgi:hypothetical protein